MLIKILVFFLIITSLTTVAYAESALEKSPWVKWGSFEIQEECKKDCKKFQSVILRWLNYANDEIMFEIERQDARKQLLLLQPSKVELYSGLSNGESPEASSGKNPFLFANEEFGLPLLALDTAFPSGLTSVPAYMVENEIVIYKKYPVILKTIRLSSDKIKFHFAIHLGSRIVDIDGIWEGKFKQPLPDGFSIADWKNEYGVIFNNLGQVRAFRKDHSQ